MGTHGRRLAPLASAALALLGLGVSAAMLVDSLRPEPAFCAAEGCAAVRATAWASPLGVPMPVIGLLFFGLALILAGAGPRLAPARKLVALAGGAGAIGLLALQGLVIREWCEMCVVADVAALAHAAAVLAAGSTWPAAGRRRIAATAAIAMAVIGLPFLGLGGSGLVTAHAPTSSHEHGSTSSPAAHGDLPEVVAREQVPGTAVVVDFIDFECQHCRALHPRLLEALERFDGPVKMVRKMVPLPGHRGALPAAIAWCCADAQGRGEAMAEALLVAPVEELTPGGCERLAASLGLDMARYQRDAASRATFQRIQGDLADARAAGVTGLPTIYIGDQVFAGARATVEELAAALALAAEA